jgi:hypothetical protein
MVTSARPNARRRRLRAVPRRVGTTTALVLIVAGLLPTVLHGQPVNAPPTVTPYPGSRRAPEMARGHEFRADVVGWLALGRVLWSSGYDQVVGSPDVWAQDAESYGRRFVTRSTQLLAIEATRHGAAALLGRDPAYVVCACDGRWRRLGHATAGVLTDFDVAGQRRAAWPRFLGAAAGALVLGQLQPGQGKPETVIVRAITTVGASWLGNVAKEFHLMPGSAPASRSSRAPEPVHPVLHPADAPSDTAATFWSHQP